MNYSKKAIAALLAITIASSLSACGSGEKETQESPKPQVETQAPMPEVQTQPVIIEEAPETQPEPEAAVSVAETVLFEADGIRITAKGIGESFMGPCMKLFVENNTDKNIAVACSDFVINDDFSIWGNMFIDVAAGKKANGDMELYQTSLDAVGITKIGSVKTMGAYIFDADSYETLYDIQLDIQTSLSGSAFQYKEFNGAVLFEQNGLKVTEIGIAKEDHGYVVRYLVSNESGQDVTSQARDVSANDFMITAGNSDTIANGTARVCQFDFYNEYLVENGIDVVEKSAFRLAFVDPISYNTILETEEITITN